VADIAAALADGEAEIIGDEATGRMLAITVEPEGIEAAAQHERDEPAKKPMCKGKGKKGVATTDSADK
jgi:hypothetical protein